MILFFHLLVLSAVSGQSNDGDDLFTSRDTWGRGLCKPAEIMWPAETQAAGAERSLLSIGGGLRCLFCITVSPAQHIWSDVPSLVGHFFNVAFSHTSMFWVQTTMTRLWLEVRKHVQPDIHNSQKITSSVFSHQSPSSQYEVILPLYY